MSSAAPLLADPPALKPLPGMVMVMVNTSTVLSCEATGVPQPEVTWQKDGVGIAGGEKEPAGAGRAHAACSLCRGGDWVSWVVGLLAGCWVTL